MIKNVIDRNCFLISKALNFDISKDDILNKNHFFYILKMKNKEIYKYLDENKKYFAHSWC